MDGSRLSLSELTHFLSTVSTCSEYHEGFVPRPYVVQRYQRRLLARRLVRIRVSSDTRLARKRCVGAQWTANGVSDKFYP